MISLKTAIHQQNLSDENATVAFYLLFGQVLLPHYIHIGSDLKLWIRRFAPCAKEHQQKHSTVISENKGNLKLMR